MECQNRKKAGSRFIVYEYRMDNVPTCTDNAPDCNQSGCQIGQLALDFVQECDCGEDVPVAPLVGSIRFHSQRPLSLVTADEWKLQHKAGPDSPTPIDCPVDGKSPPSVPTIPDPSPLTFAQRTALTIAI